MARNCWQVPGDVSSSSSCWVMQVVVNYASSAEAAEDVAKQIRESGGDAIVVQADIGKAEDLSKYAPCCFTTISIRH